MALPANKFLTGAFRVALWATLGAGGMAALDSPQQWQHFLPSLSTEDAATAHREGIELGAVTLGALTLGRILGERTGCQQEREKQTRPGR